MSIINDLNNRKSEKNISAMQMPIGLKNIKDLEESEINFRNINAQSCYQSSTLQGFVHIIFPIAIKNLNREREKVGLNIIKDLDELKNDSVYNNTIIDTLKDIINIQSNKEELGKKGIKRYEAKKFYDISTPVFSNAHEGPENIIDINNFQDNIIYDSKQLNKDIRKDFDSITEEKPIHPINSLENNLFNRKGLVKNNEIKKKTMVSEIIKFKIGGDRYYGNLVLKFTEDDLKDDKLNILKLINKCPQIRPNPYTKRKITKTSNVIIMVTDRFRDNETIKKQFDIYEIIYLDNNNGDFIISTNGVTNYDEFELQFIIYHRFFSQNSGHYIAYCKIKGEWYKFNDLDNDYANKEKPTLKNDNSDSFYPICFYYVKKKEQYFDNYFTLKHNLKIQDNYYDGLNPFKVFGLIDKKKSNFFDLDEELLKKYRTLKSKSRSNQKLLLCYFILCNLDKFDRKGDTFYIKNKDQLYYVIINDLEKLINIYEKNKYIFCQKDNYERSLLHISVIGENYEMCKFLLEKGINFNDADHFNKTPLYYADGKIRELLKEKGAFIEIYNCSKTVKGINIEFKELNKIDLIYNDFLEKKIVCGCEIIKNNNNEIIGKRLVRSTYLTKKNTINWIPVFHGTTFVSMQHILIYGLRFFGEPLNGHIPLGEAIDNINNWAYAVFATPSIFYASRYSEIIYSDNEEWYIIVEAKVRPDSFTKHQSTYYQYIYRMNEPEEIEYRINTENIKKTVCNLYRDDDNIVTTALLFVKKSFIDKSLDYSENNYFFQH